MKRLRYAPAAALLLGLLSVGFLNGPAAQTGPARMQVVQVNFGEVVGHSPTFYGVENSWIDQNRDLYLERYRRLHANVVRVQVSQEIFEPVNDNNDPEVWSGNFSAITVPVDSQRGKTLTYKDMFTSLRSEFPDMHFQINVWLAARWNASNENGYLGFGGAFPPINDAEHQEFMAGACHRGR